MRVTNIDLLTSSGTLIANLSFQDPDTSNPYLVKAITGLSPEVLVPRFSGVSPTSSAKYYSLFVAARQIVVQVGLNPNYAISDSFSSLRDALYRGIGSSRTGQIKVTFKDETGVLAQIIGFVTKFEYDMFAKIPEGKITIDCDDPILRAPAPTVIASAGFGLTPSVSDLVSTAPHGLELSVKFTGSAASFVMTDAVIPDWVFEVDYPFILNDQLFLSSRYENRFLYVVRAGVTTKLIDKIAPNSVWPVIFPGANSWNIVSGTFNWMYLNHYLSYWGV